MATINDLIQLNARFNLADNQIAENVFHVRLLAGTLDSEVKAACVEYLTAAYLEVNGFMPTSVSALDVLYRNVTANTPTESLSWGSFTGGGGAGAAQMPPGVAALITATTTIAKAVGRKYLPPFLVSAWTGSVWTGPVLAAMADFGLAWISDFSSGTSTVELRPVLYRGAIAASQVFTDVLVRSEAAYQRRRREGVGD